MPTLARKDISSGISLIDLLKRRKSTLGKFVKDTGIFTYEELRTKCQNIGAVCPTEDEFNRLNIPVVTVQSEGIIVLGEECKEESHGKEELSLQKKKKKQQLKEEIETSLE